MKNEKVQNILCLFVFGILSVAESVYAKNPKEEEIICSYNAGLKYCETKDGKPLTGKLEDTNNETGERSLESFTKGYRHGLSTFFNRDGLIVERAYYKYGILNGMDKIYYDNRTVKYLLNYDNGELDGRVDIYSENGKLRGRLLYSKGTLKEGYCVDENGKKNRLSVETIARHKNSGLYDCGVK